MDCILKPAKLYGNITAIPSKSDAHRALLLAALADRKIVLHMAGTLSEDMLATARCIEALGGAVQPIDGGVCVTPIVKPNTNPLLDCGESGSTLRFVLPIAAALTDRFSVVGHGRLPKRPLRELCDAMSSGGCSFSAQSLPLTVEGKLQAGSYTLPGNISSQYISGFLMAFPLLNGKSQILLSSALESKGYVDMTIRTMQRFGVSVERLENGFAVSNRGYASPDTLQIEGDWSNAAFWLAAKSMGHDLTMDGLDETSAQPDRCAATLLDTLGSDAVVDVSECPDLLPILSVRAAYCYGKTHFVHAERLRIKESDRLHAAAEGLSTLGAEVEELADTLIVHGHGGLRGGCTVSSYGDHRMAMAWAIAALQADAPVTVCGAEAVNKSYPAFWQEYERLGGNCHVI